MAQALDPAAGGPNPLEARIAALEQGGAGGAKPGGGGGGKGGKGEMELCIKQILNMLSILFDTMGIPVPTQAMVPDSAAATAQPGAPPAGDPAQQGPSSVLGGGGAAGGAPAPPDSVAPMTPLLGSPGGAAGGAPPAPGPKSAAWDGIAVTPDMLHSLSHIPTNGEGRRQPDPKRILGLGR
jgi:hypothetical protein